MVIDYTVIGVDKKIVYITKVGLMQMHLQAQTITGIYMLLERMLVVITFSLETVLLLLEHKVVPILMVYTSIQAVAVVVKHPMLKLQK